MLNKRKSQETQKAMSPELKELLETEGEPDLTKYSTDEKFLLIAECLNHIKPGGAVGNS